MKILCDKPECQLTGNHDHLDVVVKPVKPKEPEPAKAEAKPETKPEVQEQDKSLMGLLGDALDECAGVQESFTGKPSTLRETAKKVRKVNSAGEKLGKLGQAVQDSKLPSLGKRIFDKVKDSARMREYGK